MTEETATTQSPIASDVEIADASVTDGELNGKRAREEGAAGEEETDAAPKKMKSDKSEVEDAEGKAKEEEKVSVCLGPKKFESSVGMFDYFFKLIHHWPTNLPINKYECMVLQDLIKKGHPEPEKKIGAGIKTFQIQSHPMWKSKCFFLVRDDGSSDDFSFRKCVDHILPLPENMKGKPESNKSHRGGGGGGRGRGGKGGGRGGGRGHGERR